MNERKPFSVSKFASFILPVIFVLHNNVFPLSFTYTHIHTFARGPPLFLPFSFRFFYHILLARNTKQHLSRQRSLCDRFSLYVGWVFTICHYWTLGLLPSFMSSWTFNDCCVIALLRSDRVFYLIACFLSLSHTLSLSRSHSLSISLNLAHVFPLIHFIHWSEPSVLY